jgi:glycosyltransferase involved in cell wall biosynthesis
VGHHKDRLSFKKCAQVKRVVYLISIITPVYNGIKHIEYCIKNVIAQDCSDMEHLIIDGGSTDGTVDIIKKYADQNPYLRWISEKDEGQPDAMNKGISMARGGIICFLNVDDYFDPGAINRAVHMFKDLPDPSFLVGNCNVWSEDGKLLYVNKPRRLRIVDLLMGWDVNPHPVNPSAYFYSKSLHEVIGPIDKEDRVAHDLDFILRAVQSANVIYVNEIFGNYRFYPGTITYEDQKRGLAGDRAKYIRGKYKKQLPFIQKMDFIIRKIYYYFCNLNLKKVISG